MKIEIAILLALLAPCAAKARIGETMEQVTQRYGTPQLPAAIHPSSTSRVPYLKSGIQILVKFRDGVSQCEVFRKGDKIQLEQAEIDSLLAANSDGHKWTGGKEYGKGRVWNRDDGEATAFYTHDGALSVETAKYLEEEKAQWASKLKGF